MRTSSVVRLGGHGVVYTLELTFALADFYMILGWYPRKTFWGGAITEYRAYLLGRNGHIFELRG